MHNGFNFDGVDFNELLCYTHTMNTITITDVQQASNAGEWCAENINSELWALDVEGLFTPRVRYNFQFHDSKHATEFVLRWL
jgi:hypothetical protein